MGDVEVHALRGVTLVAASASPQGSIGSCFHPGRRVLLGESDDPEASVKSILKNSLDQQPLTERPLFPLPPAHDNIRGAKYFE